MTSRYVNNLTLSSVSDIGHLGWGSIHQLRMLSLPACNDVAISAIVLVPSICRTYL